MILFLDLRNDAAAVGVIGAMDASWAVAAGSRTGFAALAKAKRLLGAKTPSCVVVATGAGPSRDVSWSTVRSGIAMANALAFAWNVPVAEIAIDGDEPRADLAALARKAAKKAKKGRWIVATYSGEPHITVAKKII